MSVRSILKEVAEECKAQVAKWGQQNHGWAGPEQDFEGQLMTPFEAWILQPTWRIKSQYDAKTMVQLMADEGTLGYCDILMEEVCEALDEADIAKVRQELVQVAAVAVSAIESIDRNGR